MGLSIFHPGSSDGALCSSDGTHAVLVASGRLVPAAAEPG